MSIAPYPYQPDYAVHPGGTLKETIEAKGKTLAEFAKEIGMPLEDFLEVVEGRAPITSNLAKKLHKALDVPISFWLNYQDNYDRTNLRLCFKKARVKPNLFAHFSDAQMEALQALLENIKYEAMPKVEDVGQPFYDTVDFLEEQFNQEFNNRFFPQADRQD